MQTSYGFSSEPLRMLSWQSDTILNPVEHLLEHLLTGKIPPGAPPETALLAEHVLQSKPSAERLVVIGGGTGLSTIVGGNSRLPDWPDQPNIGLKRDFSNLTAIVCTTDDGGSTGRLLQILPMIAVGDLRKLLLSSISPQKLQSAYGLNAAKTANLIRLLYEIFNYRFREEETSDFDTLRNPLRVVSPSLLNVCPKILTDALRELGTYISPEGPGPTIHTAGHSLGNLLLTAVIFREASGETSKPPGLREIQRGIDCIAVLIGAPAGMVHAATSTPGQLKFCYANGVSVLGQSKSTYYRRSSPVNRVVSVYASRPITSLAGQKALREADAILYAPGSLYSSILPVLQLEPIISAIRDNHKALKILGANAWIQEGETDISLKNQGRGFQVSELIEAYDRNIPGGVHGMLDVVLSANLEHVPGNILRNYALEGKYPIFLDKSNVESLGIRSIEATLFSQERQVKNRIIQHDPQRFSLAIRTLLYADRHLRREKVYSLRGTVVRKQARAAMNTRKSGTKEYGRKPFLCEHMSAIRKQLQNKNFQPKELRDILTSVAWENRDIQPAHLAFFKGVHVLTANQWNRSTEWDNVLGYFDPEDQIIKLHQSLIHNPARLQEDLLVALGESLLGCYIETRRWIPQKGSRVYEILLRLEKDRNGYLTNAQLHTYLKLAKMIQDPVNDRIYQIVINEGGGFLPSGLMFGLMYSWYILGRGFTAEYEMSLLQWPLKSLNPLHAKDRIRKEALVSFFRTEIFGHKD